MLPTPASAVPDPEIAVAAYIIAAGHEESSKQDHHLRVFAMAKVHNSLLACLPRSPPGTA